MNFAIWSTPLSVFKRSFTVNLLKQNPSCTYKIHVADITKLPTQAP